MSGSNIKVVVRCRPLNSREKARGAPCLIRMEGNKTIITKPATQGPKPTPEDIKMTQIMQIKNVSIMILVKSFWIMHLMDIIAVFLHVDGQTGAGKSYSMMGYGEDKGIIPRTCCELFERINQKSTNNLQYQVEVSYIEIYNEKVRDLLNPRNKGNLKVREHPVLGPYVQDLSRLAVNSYENIDQLMDEGNKARTVAATNMNETSSRSHAVFTIFVTQRLHDPQTKQTSEKVARISLVDLAGSERANSTGATGVRLKEGANINKSLTTLGKVIAGLAEQASADPKKGSKKKDASFIPFRDSVLTWLLKDSLGGNSKTCMIAAISPADYDETLSTLRYADQAKKIKTKAVVNEDPNAKVMRELKDEVEALRQALMVYAPAEVEKITATAKGKKAPAKSSTPPTAAAHPTGSKSTVVFTDASGHTTQLTKEEMVEQLQTTEKLLGDLNQTWEEKIKNTEKIHQERESALKSLGITIEKNQVGLYTPKETPYLINLNEDPLMSECLMYNIKPGITHVDRFTDEGEASVSHPEGECVIRLSGSNIQDNHCYFENTNDTVTLYPREGCTTMVNGLRISEPKKLKSGYRIILGDYHVFRFNNPSQALKERESIISTDSAVARIEASGPPSPVPSSEEREMAMSPPLASEVMDWNFARREAMLNTYINDPNFNNFTDEDLDKLFDEVAKVRVMRKRQSTGSDTLSRRTSSSSVRRSAYSATASSVFMDDDGYYTTDTSTTISSLTEDELMHMDDKQVMEYERHRRKYEAKLRRLSRRFSSAPPIMLSPAEAAIGRKVIAHWKRKRNIAMAQTILRNDIYVQQANQLAKQSGKDVFYQFAVIYHDDIISASHWEAANSSHHRYGIDTDLLRERKPCIGIQVIDYKHQSTYIWSIEKFVTRLRHLQGLNFVTDNKKHLKGDDLFYNSNVPSYVLVGLAKVPLQNLATQVPVESQISVHCRNTGRLMGKLKVLIAPIARSVRNPYRSEGSEDGHFSYDEENPRNLLHIGQQLVFEISIVEMTELDPKLFSRVHAQFRLSNFGSNLEGVFASDSVEHSQKDKPIVFNYHQTLSMAITEEMLNVIHDKEIVFEVYGKPTQAYLDSLMIPTEQQQSADVGIIPPKKLQDVLTRIQICEITAEGDYKPVPIETQENYGNVFSLQQGQQRRVIISLEDATAESELNFERIVEVRMGQVRLVDAKDRIIETPASAQADINLKLIDSKRNSQASVTDDHKLNAQCSWDSSLHDTLLLNAVTPNAHKVLLTLTWIVRNQNQCEIKFQKEIAVHIKDQSKAASIKKKSANHNPNKRASVILNFFSLKSGHPKNHISCLYVVEHQAELFGIPNICNQDLPSRVLGVYADRRQKMIQREHVEATRYKLYLNEQLDHLCDEVPNPVLANKPDLDRVLKMWMKKDYEPALPPSTPNPTIHRWTAHVHQVLMNERTIAKKGFLQRKNDSQGKEWEKLWCVLVGNYMFMYDDQSETNEVDVIRIRNVHKEDGNTMKSKTFFTIDTLYTSHTLQAQDNATMIEWVNTIDKLSRFYG
ncbi:kinesin-like protein Klp8 [Rhizopus azygosporus]|uniref:Kinesin-like protein unc-104 n=1 Tax=Rhizopus azygosporus TaxID=86630 RepID=A0A367JDU5_RHIAZ|nr:kinesin-like protein Klp8 [Rhizopus azygosporus]